MRGAFGLVSLLICVALVAYMWANHTSAVSNSGNPATDQARRIAGYDADGKSALESIKIEREVDSVTHKTETVVSDIVAGGAMDQAYGLKKGDKIITLGEYPLMPTDDAGTASAMLLKAFQASQSVEVIRAGKQISLPLPGTAGKTIQDQFNQLQHVGQ
jgi:hypothetical protein